MENTNTEMTKLPELLAPAGSPEALHAAIEAGADAVYFGGELYSNRMRAKNFTSQELIAAVHTCNTYGVSSFITMNTRLREWELPPAVEAAGELYKAGATAFIVADAALAALLREAYPDIELHASTQMTGQSSADAKALASIGFSRMVCPRELSYRELCRLVKDSPIAIEMFIHGAHCVSLSGQCLMSWAMGGRSGNRGECAQPCRLPYRCSELRRCKGEHHPLSLKDMCLASHIPEIIDSGVASLKIEGRLKSPDYVYGVTRIYRRLLDERRSATPKELACLEAIFSRDGFTDGYFKGSFRSMTGMRPENAVSEGEAFYGLSRKVSLSASVSLTPGEAARLTLSDGAHTVTVSGDVVGEARNAPLSPEQVAKSLTKLGGTPYSLSAADLECNINGNVFLAASQLNELRRVALTALEDARKASCARSDRRECTYTVGDYPAPAVQNTAFFLRSESIPDEAYDFFDVIYLYEKELTKVKPDGRCEIGLILPTWTPDEGKLRRSLEAFAASGGRQVLCHTPGQIYFAAKAGLVPTASYRMNVTSPKAAEESLRLGAKQVLLSPELNSAAMADIARKIPTVGAVVFGKIPLMFLRRCIMSDRGCSGNCGGEGCHLPETLADRRGAKITVIPTGDRANVILNPSTIYMADRQEKLSRLAIRHFMFSLENRDTVRGLIHAYREGLPPQEAGIGQIKRV